MILNLNVQRRILDIRDFELRSNVRPAILGLKQHIIGKYIRVRDEG